MSESVSVHPHTRDHIIRLSITVLVPDLTVRHDCFWCFVNKNKIEMRRQARKGKLKITVKRKEGRKTKESLANVFSSTES